MLPAVSLSGRLQNAAQNYCTYERNAREIYDCHPREVFNTKVVKDWIVPTATSLAIAILTAPLDVVVTLLSTFTIIPLLFLDNKKEHLINVVMAVCVAVIAPFVFLINLFGAGQFLPLDYSRSYLNYRPSLKMLLIASARQPRLESSIKPLASILIKDNVLVKLSFEEQVIAILLNSKLSEDLYAMRIIADKPCYSLINVLATLTLDKEEKINLIKKLVPLLDLNIEDDSEGKVFMHACAHDYSEIVDLLLPFAKKCSTKFFANAFHSACTGGNKEIIHKIYNACPDLVPFINKTHTPRFGGLSLDLVKLLTEFGMQFTAEDLVNDLSQRNYEVAEWIANHNPSIKNLDNICISNFSLDTHNTIVYNLAELGLYKTCKLMHACYSAYVNHDKSVDKFTKKNYKRYLSFTLSYTIFNYIKERNSNNKKVIEALLPDLQDVINFRFSWLLRNLAYQKEARTNCVLMMLLLFPYVTFNKKIFETTMIAFAECGDFEELNTLLTYNVDINSPILTESAAALYPWTNHNIIYKALKNNEDLKLAKLLIEHGAFFPRDVPKEAIPRIYGIEIDPNTQEILTPMPAEEKLKIIEAAKHCDQLSLLQDHHNTIRISLKLQLETLNVTQALGHIVADYAYGPIDNPRAQALIAANEELEKEEDVEVDGVKSKSVWDDLRSLGSTRESEIDAYRHL